MRAGSLAAAGRALSRTAVAVHPVEQLRLFGGPGVTLGLGHCIAELAQVSAEGGEEAPERAPPNIAPAALDTREVRRVDAGAGRNLVLREPRLRPQDA
jgi:hypothetical protein